MVGIYLTDVPYDQLRADFDQLSDGADPDLLDDLRDMPFGVYGHLVDKYDVQWFFRGEPRDAEIAAQAGLVELHGFGAVAPEEKERRDVRHPATT